MDGRARRRLPDRRPVRLRSTRAAPRCSAPAAATGAWSTPRGGRSTRSARCSTVCVVVLEAAFLRSDFSVALVADHSSTTTPAVYKLTAMWSSQGGSLLLWAWVLSIAVERGALADPQPPPRGRPLRDRGARRDRPLLRRADAVRRRREPVRAPRPGAGRGRRAEPAAAPPGDGDPPADALLGLRPLLDPVRVRDRGADHPPPRRELDPLDPALRARRLDLPLDRDPARRPLVLLGARLGRLLGLGRGRERVADAVAGRHRLPALGDGPGEARACSRSGTCR